MSTGSKDLPHLNILLSFCLPGRYFLSFWGPMKTDSKHQKDYIIDVFDRATHTKGWQNQFFNHLNLFLVRRLSELHGKPDIVRVVSELGIVLLSYPSLLMVEVLCWFENYMLFRLPWSAFLILLSSSQVVRLESFSEDDPREYIDLARFAFQTYFKHIEPREKVAMVSSSEVSQRPGRSVTLWSETT